MANSISLFILFCTFQYARCQYPDLQIIKTANFMDKPVFGYTAAFGDIDSDRNTDVFVLQDGGFLSVFCGHDTDTDALLQHCLNISVGESATSVVPADFNEDGYSDVLVTYSHSNSAIGDSSTGKTYSLAVFFGADKAKILPNDSYVSPEQFIDEPLVLDANGDMIADLFVVYPNNTRGFLLGEKKRNNWSLKSHSFTKNEKHDDDVVVIPHSHAFVDLTGEGSADLFVTSKSSNGTPIYEVWKGSLQGLVKDSVINLPPHSSNAQFSHAAFTDFTGNAQQDILVAVCDGDGVSCKDSKFWVYSSNSWHTLLQLPSEWSFPNSSDLRHVDNTLHIADVNQDSYPDLMTILHDKAGNRKAVICYNVPCSSEQCSTIGRQLRNPVKLEHSDDAVIASFFDFSMDGSMDVILTIKKEGKLSMQGYKNMIADDVTFLRVQVLSGLSDKSNYGVNIPGPQIMYKTTNTTGGQQRGCFGQMSQSAHLSLQLPYVMFGLGRLANFVDSLTVSIPVPLIVSSEVTITEVESIDQIVTDDPFRPLHHSWPMLIPNSQLYVTPYPQKSPSSWTNRVLVTPSQNVIMTAVVLGTTCGVIAIATVVLHWLERREDRQEKIQEAYRFHFDAM